LLNFLITPRFTVRLLYLRNFSA